MIGQCLRFWPAYELLKEYVDNGEFGKVVSAYFFRGGATPLWSYKNWLLDKNKSGGCMLDQHIHDVDMVNWLFGKPEKLSSIGLNIIEGSGYDAVSTNYIYNDGKVVNTQDDWTINGEYGFEMRYRANFQKGNIIFEKGKVTVNPKDGSAFIPELPKEDGYYREIKYYINSLLNDTPIETATPQSTKETIEIAMKEVESADKRGEVVYL